ncbi:MAG TPA: rRNA maturation RNase YbeY [Tahibacter sp.]|nr:rRNA maturation RNase YbeY [Tahibacter sp.]
MWRGTLVALDLHLSYAPGVSRRGVPARTSFTAWADAALAVARRRRATELSIRLVDADEGRELNRQYRGRDYATNVLSFPAELPRGIALPLIGDLVICTSVVAREAIEQEKPLKHHYAHMTVHGVLHLLGYDHIADDEAERMEALERRALASLGIADPYA